MAVVLIIAVGLVAYLAYRYKMLTSGGAWTACLIGTVITLAFSYEGLIVLGAFFIGSTLLGRMPATSHKREKEVRTAAQVIANGGVAALIAIFALVMVDDELAKVMFISAIAAANSDTWATEGGKRWGGSPYHLRLNARAMSGRSGAVTWIGTLFSIAGSGLIALIGSLLLLDGTWMILILIAGFLGATADTFVGAYFQEERHCVYCNSLTEEKSHCNHPTVKTRGLSGFDNNKVNMVCTIIAPVFVMILFYTV